MSGGAKLSTVEQGQVRALEQQNLSLRAIANAVGRSKTIVRNFLKDPDGYAAKKRKGKTRKLSERDQRVLFRQATLHKKSASQIVPSLSMPVSACAVCRELQRNDNTKYAKRDVKLKLKPHHVAARLTWARARIKERTIREKVIFSDEKKFNLDGPDGLQYYWQDLRKEKETYFSRQSGGGSVMAWGTLSHVGRSELAVLSGRQDSYGYQQTLTKFLFPLADDTMGGTYVFQHDNASIHSSTATSQSLSDLEIVTKWVRARTRCRSVGISPLDPILWLRPRPIWPVPDGVLDPDGCGSIRIDQTSRSDYAGPCWIFPDVPTSRSAYFSSFRRIITL